MKIKVSDELLGATMFSGGLLAAAVFILFGHDLLSSRLVVSSVNVAECAYCVSRLAPILPQVLVATGVIGGLLLLRLIIVEWRPHSS